MVTPCGRMPWPVPGHAEVYVPDTRVRERLRATALGDPHAAGAPCRPCPPGRPDPREIIGPVPGLRRTGLGDLDLVGSDRLGLRVLARTAVAVRGRDREREIRGRRDRGRHPAGAATGRTHAAARLPVLVR